MGQLWKAFSWQDLRPPFDIHDYGDRILEKLSHRAENGNVMSFSEVVSGQEKHDVARSFSALLQLVKIPLSIFENARCVFCSKFERRIASS